MNTKSRLFLLLSFAVIVIVYGISLVLSVGQTRGDFS